MLTFFPVWQNEHIVISGAYSVCLSLFKFFWVHIDEVYAHVHFEAIMSTLNFRPSWTHFGPEIQFWITESSDKILMKIIKKFLTENKKSWNIHLKYSLWANRIGTKKSIGMSPFQLVYGTYVILPINLVLLVMKL
jgi:hypothetical protein